MKQTRREFLTWLGLVFQLLNVPAKRRKDEWEFILDSFHIAGFQHHDGPGLLKRLRRGRTLALSLEPDNLYDSHAVRIESGEHHLGYVPKARNGVIQRLLQQEAPLGCRIRRVQRTVPLCEAVEVDIVLSSSLLGMTAVPPTAGATVRRTRIAGV